MSASAVTTPTSNVNGIVLGNVNNGKNNNEDSEVSISASSTSSFWKTCCDSRFWMIDLFGTCRCSSTFLSSDIVIVKKKNDENGTNSGKKEKKMKVRKEIDFLASFSPPLSSKSITKLKEADSEKSRFMSVSFICIVVWKLLVIGLEIYAILLGTAFQKDGVTSEWFYLAFLTTWALIVATVYSVLSLMNTIIPVKVTIIDGVYTEDIDIEINRNGNATENTISNIVSIRTKFTWTLCTMAGGMQLVVTLMYWLLVYKPEKGTPTVKSIVEHGGIMVLVWIDALCVNKVPIRLRHWFEFLLPIYTCYAIWTLLQFEFDVDNPYKDETNKIYAVLDWANPPKAFSLIMMIMFIASPLIHILLWSLSLPKRRYLN